MAQLRHFERNVYSMREQDRAKEAFWNKTFESRDKKYDWVWRSLVACLNGVQEAGGSNPLTQTIKGQRELSFYGLSTKDTLRSKVSKVQTMCLARNRCTIRKTAVQAVFRHFGLFFLLLNHRSICTFLKAKRI